MEFILDQSSKRARKARTAKQLQSKPLIGTALGLVLICLMTAIYLLLNGLSVGWLLLLPPLVVLMTFIWYRGDLKYIGPGNFETTTATYLQEALEPNTLAKLNKESNMSAFDIWKALEGSEDCYFLANRYGIDSSFFENFVSQEPDSAVAVWHTAFKLHQSYQTADYSNMLVLVALVKSVTNIEQLLRSVSLELKDIESGIPWMEDIRAKRRLVRQKKTFGGIGRDWAYGYTPILRNLGHNISEEIQRYGFFSDTSMHHQIVDQMAQVLGSSNSPLTLVGDEGVGKTTCVYAFAEVLLTDASLPKRIRYSQVVQLDASTLIANSRQPGELEDLMLRILNEAYHAKNIILFFDEAQLFFDNGTGSVDISKVLLPALESGSIRFIFAMNPQYWQRLSQSGIAARLSPVTVPPADEENTLAILRDQISSLEYRHKVVFTYQALQEAYKLGSRYVTTQSMPGAALNVLQQAATTTQQSLITRELVQQSVELTYGIKLQTATNTESSNLLNLEDELKKQVISQDRAITVVANALRRARSGVGNPNRPIGTFLFLGPTGVGKTELSKALARSYFGNEEAMIRVDMNQYVAAGDVARLIAPMQGSELGFLGEVRKKPFSVILLDEIEKAHPAVINTLLQTLDEGMMRDSDNKTVSFRDAIIIATSNAGADEICRLIDEGQDVSSLEATFTDTLISKGSFAPEFINRFDEVVLFKPLSQEELVSVIDLIIAEVNSTLDAQKVRVELTDDAKRWLVAKGYDAKLGARPMRRMAQRYVENIVAKRILTGGAQSGMTVQLDTTNFEAEDQ